MSIWFYKTHDSKETYGPWLYWLGETILLYLEIEPKQLTCQASKLTTVSLSSSLTLTNSWCGLKMLIVSFCCLWKVFLVLFISSLKLLDNSFEVESVWVNYMPDIQCYQQVNTLTYQPRSYSSNSSRWVSVLNSKTMQFVEDNIWLQSCVRFAVLPSFKGSFSGLVISGNSVYDMAHLVKLNV